MSAFSSRPVGYQKTFLQVTSIHNSLRLLEEMVGTQERKKKGKKQQLPIFEQQLREDVAVQNAKNASEALAELEKQGHQVDIQVCPKCKSPKIERAKSTGGDMWAHIGMLPPSYECPKCVWQECLVLEATNKTLSVRGAR